MKLLSILALTALTFSALGSTQLESRHMKLIEKAIKEQCHLRKITISNISSRSQEHRIDQGIVDYDFVSLLEVRNEFDQGQYDNYSVKVISHYSDAYDHNSRNWGIYSVSSVNCELK